MRELVPYGIVLFVIIGLLCLIRLFPDRVPITDIRTVRAVLYYRECYTIEYQAGGTSTWWPVYEIVMLPDRARRSDCTSPMLFTDFEDAKRQVQHFAEPGVLATYLQEHRRLCEGGPLEAPTFTLAVPSQE